MSVMIKIEMPIDCWHCPLEREWNYCQYTGEDTSRNIGKRPDVCPLIEVNEKSGIVSDICMDCRHCVKEEITDGLDGYVCEEGMENFYNGNQEGCYQFWRKEEDDEF